jgi:hypothetical protein
MARSPVENYELCRQSILDNAPAVLLNSDFHKAVGFNRLVIDPVINDGSRGYATPQGHVHLSAKGTVKFRAASPYSAPCGKSDMSPTGVLAHEIGHLVQFKLYELRARTLIQLQRDLFANDRRHAVTSYARSCWQEDFAEAHRLFILNPDLLRHLSAERYDLVAACYTRIIGQRKLAGFKVAPTKRSANLLQLMHS